MSCQVTPSSESR